MPASPPRSTRSARRARSSPSSTRRRSSGAGPTPVPGPFSLEGRVALLTGASRGLGHAMAKAMAEAGATVVLYARDEAALGKAAAAIPGAASAAFDVADEAAAKHGVAEVLARHGRIDILVNNAGIQHRRPLGEFATEDWRRVLDVHLTGAFVL